MNMCNFISIALGVLYLGLIIWAWVWCLKTDCTVFIDWDSNCERRKIDQPIDFPCRRMRAKQLREAQDAWVGNYNFEENEDGRNG